jgi:hypothetical protein
MAFVSVARSTPNQLSAGVVLKAEKEVFEAVRVCSRDHEVNKVDAHFVAHDLGTFRAQAYFRLFAPIQDNIEAE